MSESEQLKLEEKAQTSSINEDMISNLPDPLLCHILSFLPTVTSVATSILSRRWRHLWKDLQVFYFEEGADYCKLKGSRFVAFVNAVLDNRRFPHIQKFHLSSDVTEHDAVEMWIHEATGPQLQELYLDLPKLDEGFCLPHEVFTCKSLEFLSLEGYMHLYELPYADFPSLKYLMLKIATLDSINVILSGCPVIETLVFVPDIIESHTIHMPHSLKSLTFVEESGYITIFEDLEIDTPFLECLYISIGNFRILNLNLDNNFPDMVEAHVDIYLRDEHVGWVVKLLKALCRTKLLVLTNSTTECMLRAPTLDCLEFRGLLHLQLELPCFSSSFLVGLLHNCHKLKVLIISNSKGGDHSSRHWTEPASVPNCFLSELEIFEFERYQHTRDEYALIAYFLQNGLVLKTMIIHTNVLLWHKKKHRILNKLSVIPRISNTCQLEVDGINI